MTYNPSEHSRYLMTAGKISISAAVVGLAVFIVAFMFDAGTQELSRVSAQQGATTTLTVLNTPPSFVVNAYEVIESSTSSPTNSGDVIQWAAVANDSNNAPYFLLICDTSATPTANAASSVLNLGTAPPDCSPTSTVQWAVSPATPSDDLAVAATTTTEAAPFAELNNWFAWVCDDDPVNPRCNNVPVQGFSATNSSPFNVNFRPVFTDLSNDGPVDPGGVLEFSSTSSDPDVVGGADEIILIVCQAASYSTTTRNCDPADFLASTTVSTFDDASAIYTLAAIVRDDSYPAFGYIIDEHGHQALANPISNPFVVNNVAPQVLGGEISLNGGLDLDGLVAGQETPGFTLDFTIRDANSCVNALGDPEITGYVASVFRSSYGTTTCDGTAGSYNPNFCYPSGIATTTWDLECTQVTACGGPTQEEIDFECTFPLWFVADPTTGHPNLPLAFSSDNWSAAVRGIDDNSATGAFATSSAVDLVALTALDLVSGEIPYGALEPGDNSGTLNASTTVRSIGNTGLDQDVRGESMCGTFAVGNPCPASPTSTIPESEQQFSSTTLSYDPIGPLQPGLFALSSTTYQTLDINVAKTTSTSSPNTGDTYWGISVPLTISLAGSYQGLNTFLGVTAAAENW